MYADQNIPYFNEDSRDAVFIYNEMGVVNIDRNNISLLLILIVIILVLMLLLMKKILILLFLSDFWLGMLNLKNAKKLENN